MLEIEEVLVIQGGGFFKVGPLGGAGEGAKHEITF